MLYQHQSFSLDTDSRKVFDENLKELRLTGNAYRMLVFLLGNRHGSVSDIGEYLDQAKDYDENHLRQYRYKINTIIGKDIVEYSNGIYSLKGNIKQENNRITDLLPASKLDLNAGSLPNKVSRLPMVACFIIIALTLLDLPSNIYMLLRLIIFSSTLFYAYWIYKVQSQTNLLLWLLILVALIFNPITPVYLYNKLIWWILDLIALLIITISFLTITRKFRLLKTIYE